MDWLSGQKQRSAKPYNRWFKSNIHLGDCRLMVGQMFVVHSIRVRFSSVTPYIAGRRVPNQSHKLRFPVSTTGPATKYFRFFLHIFFYLKNFSYICHKIMVFTTQRMSTIQSGAWNHNPLPKLQKTQEAVKNGTKRVFHHYLTGSLNSVGQSSWFVISLSAVRIRQGAQQGSIVV